jgi:hypothetical protein
MIVAGRLGDPVPFDSDLCSIRDIELCLVASLLAHFCSSFADKIVLATNNFSMKPGVDDGCRLDCAPG